MNAYYTRAEGAATSANTSYYWWLRSPYSTTAGHFAHVHSDEGKVKYGCYSANYFCVVRLASAM